MEREITITADGSPTIWVPLIKESYHSKFGALQESRHVFIEAGLHALDAGINPVHILEVGFGTGLNTLLTLETAVNRSRPVYYEALEPFPLTQREIDALTNNLDGSGRKNQFKKIHEAGWHAVHEIAPAFRLSKQQSKLEDFTSDQQFQLVYYDAFSPEVQPELWTAEIFQKMYQLMMPGGIIVTYCSKGKVRRNMQEAGFKVEKLPGAVGKREMLRGWREC